MPTAQSPVNVCFFAVDTAVVVGCYRAAATAAERCPSGGEVDEDSSGLLRQRLRR